jgi:DNA-binding transcriptional LysR family regulator
MDAMSSDSQRYFIAAAEELHFAHAARSLGIPRSVLIATVKKLEADLGYPLFDYAAETTRLTEAGSALLTKLKAERAKSAANAAALPPGGKAKASKGKGRTPAIKGAPRVGKRRQSR